MKELIRIRQWKNGSVMYLEWRAKLLGQEYGMAIPAAKSLGLSNDRYIEMFVKHMNDSVQKILHGKTPGEKFEEERALHRLFEEYYEAALAALQASGQGEGRRT